MPKLLPSPVSQVEARVVWHPFPQKDHAGYLHGEEEVVGLFSTWPGWIRPDPFVMGLALQLGGWEGYTREGGVLPEVSQRGPSGPTPTQD